MIFLFNTVEIVPATVVHVNNEGNNQGLTVTQT